MIATCHSNNNKTIAEVLEDYKNGLSFLEDLEIKMKGMNTMIKKAELVIGRERADFQEELDSCLANIQCHGHEIDDIKLSTDDDYFNALIIYHEKERRK